MLLAKLPWDPGGSLVWVGEIMEPKKDLWLLSRPWAPTIISFWWEPESLSKII